MGKDYQKKSSKKAAETKDANARKPSGIPKYQHFPKASLAPYPDEDGNALWLGDSESLQELLSPSNILASRRPTNSEMLARPGMAISLSAAAIHHGAKELLEGKGAKALEKLSPFFETSSGKDLLGAVRTLNLGKSGSASRSALKKAVKKYVDFMQADNTDLQKALVRVVNTASRAYLLAMHLLEQRAFFLKTGSWAKKWKRSGKEPSEIKAWLKEPSSTNKLTTALIDAVLQKIKQSRKKVKDSESGDTVSKGDKSDSGSDAAAASSASSSHRRTKTSRKDKKSKKDRKGKKEKKSAKSSSTEEKEKKPKKRSASSDAGKSSPSKPSSSPKAAASRRRSRSPRRRPAKEPRALSLGSEDEATSLAPPSEADALKQWSGDAARALADAAATALANIESKDKGLSHAALVNHMDNIPKDALEVAGLTQPLEGLKKLTKLPKKTKLEQLLKELQALAARRETLEESDKEGKKKKKNRRVVLSIQRLTPSGKAASEDSCKAADTVEVDAEDTVEDALAIFFAADGADLDRNDWLVKTWDKDRLLKDIYPETKMVKDCHEVALLQKRR